MMNILPANFTFPYTDSRSFHLWHLVEGSRCRFLWLPQRAGTSVSQEFLLWGRVVFRLCTELRYARIMVNETFFLLAAVDLLNGNHFGYYL